MIKSILSNRYVELALRLLLGLVFLFASIDKISNPTAYATAITNYKLISGPTAMLLATALPWVELLCAIAVLSGIFRQGATLLLLLMLSVFTIAVITGLIRGLDISCGCFTLDPHVNRIGWQKVLENLGLILASTVLFYSKHSDFVLKHYSQ